MIGGGGTGGGNEMAASRVQARRERENTRRRGAIADDEAVWIVEPDGTTRRKDWIDDIVDSEKFQWESDGEANPSWSLALRNLDVAGPSMLVRQDSNGGANGKAPSNSLVEGYVEMGFPEEMVMKGINEIGHSDANALLELLLTYKTLANEAAVGNCSMSSFIPQSVEDDDDLDFDNWDGEDDADEREPNFDGFEDEDFVREISEKNKIKSLLEMGFAEDEANMAVTRCGVDAALSVLVDSIYASQAAGDCHSRNLSEYEVTNRFIESCGGRKKARLMEESKKKRKRYGGGAQGSQPPLNGNDEESMPLPKLMVGFNLPSDTRRTLTRTLPKQAIGPPFFYYENVARAPKGVWDKISRSLYEIAPEFVDSLHFCATARKRGYIHNLPIGNRFPLPRPPMTIFEAFPHYKKWWPSWDPREQLNCLLTSVACPSLSERIHCALASSVDPPPPDVQKYVMRECRKGNLVWVGKNKVAPLEPHEMEFLLGFPRDHTRGGVSNTKRYQSLGNSFQVDTVAYHLSVLKDMFPNGVNVLSLFTGIGGGEVALHRLGIHMKTVISVEICEVNRRILRGWWDQTQTGTLIEINDVKTLSNDRIASFVATFGGFDLVIGGSPCNNLAGRNRYHRDGLEGKESSLFYDYVRILNVVKSAMANM